MIKNPTTGDVVPADHPSVHVVVTMSGSRVVRTVVQLRLVAATAHARHMDRSTSGPEGVPHCARIGVAKGGAQYLAKIKNTKPNACT